MSSIDDGAPQREPFAMRPMLVLAVVSMSCAAAPPPISIPIPPPPPRPHPICSDSRIGVDVTVQCVVQGEPDHDQLSFVADAWLRLGAESAAAAGKPFMLVTGGRAVPTPQFIPGNKECREVVVNRTGYAISSALTAMGNAMQAGAAARSPASTTCNPNGFGGIRCETYTAPTPRYSELPEPQRQLVCTGDDAHVVITSVVMTRTYELLTFDEALERSVGTPANRRPLDVEHVLQIIPPITIAP